MNLATTANWDKKEAITARLERELKNKEYALKLATPYKDDARNPYYYSSAKYDFDVAKKDVEYDKNANY